MGRIWNTTTVSAQIDVQDMRDELDRLDRMDEGGRIFTDMDVVVDLDEVLEEATADQLRAALAREEAPGYTQEQLTAIEDAFAAVLSGNLTTASALIGRIFEHEAQRQAAERGLSFCTRLRA